MAPHGRSEADLRVITLNAWGIHAPLERRLALAIRQLRDLAPDVVCLQEVRPLDRVAGRTTADVIAEALGMTAHYRVSEQSSDGQEGLAVLARSVGDVRAQPLPAARPSDPAILLSAQVDSEGGAIWIHTTHLHYRLDEGFVREQQVLAIDSAIRALRTDTGPPQILCGDFNATPDSDELRFLRGLTTLGGRRTHFQDAWLRLHREARPGDGPAQGITWSSENELTRASRELDIDRRIDYVLVTSRLKDGRGTVHASRVVLTGQEGAGADAICASDHYGVLADVQRVANP